ncbi:MAG: TIGR03915 family putative DNA repair protein [Clostridia bacterium]|nr:TIGR03915 family putative DNA repair protein [Clostridia bacterium]
MFNRRDVIFLYDGSFYGLLTVIFVCYYTHTYPAGIEINENVQQELLCDYEYIETDTDKAMRVEKSVLQKISFKALHNIFYAYLSNMENKGITIFNYIRAGYKFGRELDNHMVLDCVNDVLKAAQNVAHEAHLLTGFIRFSKLKNGAYYAQITPKNNVLPVIEEHFTERYGSMAFLIHDTRRNMCLVYNGTESVIRTTVSLPKLEPADDEKEYQKLWKCFFDTVEIKERHNEMCQNNHLYKRFRKNMTEFNTY